MQAKTGATKATARPRMDPTEVLRLVNVGRHALGKRPLSKLPKGERGSWYECPLGRAFGGPVISNGRNRHFILMKGYAEAIAFASALGATHPRHMTLRATGTRELCVFLPSALDRFALEHTDGRFPEFVEDGRPAQQKALAA
jgi:hypothetical protein